MARSEDPTIRLIREAHDGSTEALGRLFEGCRADLLCIARGELDPRLRAKGGASDLVQETFLEAQRDFEHFTGESERALLAWLRLRLELKLINFARRYRGTAKRDHTREVPLDDGDSSTAEGPVPTDRQPSPSEQVIAIERKRRIDAAVKRLPDAYRQVVELRYMEGLTFDAIGTAMGRTENSARKLWDRAIERLERDLRDMGSS